MLQTSLPTRPRRMKSPSWSSESSGLPSSSPLKLSFLPGFHHVPCHQHCPIARVLAEVAVVAGRGIDPCRATVPLLLQGVTRHYNGSPAVFWAQLPATQQTAMGSQDVASVWHGAESATPRLAASICLSHLYVKHACMHTSSEDSLKLVPSFWLCHSPPQCFPLAPVRVPVWELHYTAMIIILLGHQLKPTCSDVNFYEPYPL